MTAVPVLEAVPNLSEGRDPAWLAHVAERLAASGVDVLDHSSDPDHNRSVVTMVGDPPAIERAAVLCARLAMDRIDLRTHAGVHPRLGAVDVLPFVPLRGLTMDDAVASAHRVGEALAALGLPVYYYGAAGPRRLADLRRGGFEALRGGFPPGREPDVRPLGPPEPHPTAGAVCVGARDVLLAWNVFVDGVSMEDLEVIATEARESGGGFRTLRALALELPSTGRRQVSMNLEDLAATSPLEVFEALEQRVAARGGRVTGTEVVGMIPDALVLQAAEDRLKLLGLGASHLLSARLAEHVSQRLSRDLRTILEVISEVGDEAPRAIRDAAERVSGGTTHIPGGAA